MFVKTGIKCTNLQAYKILTGTKIHPLIYAIDAINKWKDVKAAKVPIDVINVFQV